MSKMLIRIAMQEIRQSNSVGMIVDRRWTVLRGRKIVRYEEKTQSLNCEEELPSSEADE